MRMIQTIRFAIFSLMIFPLVLFAQLPPNGGFEQWTGGNPDNWVTNNIPGLAVPVTQSQTSHSGSSAVRGEVVLFSDAAYPPLLYSGVPGFSVDQRYAALNGYYRFSPVSGDSLSVFVILYNNFVPVAVASVYLPATSSNYVPFSIPMEYVSEQTPDQCVIEVLILNTLTDVPHVGSVFLMDDLSLTGQATSISDRSDETLPQSFTLEQNYPNPFNPSTTISYTIPAAGKVRLDIYNELGEWVTTLVNEPQAAGNHVIPWQPQGLASGVYLYRVQTAQGVLMRKMLLVK